MTPLAATLIKVPPTGKHCAKFLAPPEFEPGICGVQKQYDKGLGGRKYVINSNTEFNNNNYDSTVQRYVRVVGTLLNIWKVKAIKEKGK